MRWKGKVTVVVARCCGCLIRPTPGLDFLCTNVVKFKTTLLLLSGLVHHLEDPVGLLSVINGIFL